MFPVKQEDIKEEVDLLEDIVVYDEFSIYYKQEIQENLEVKEENLTDTNINNKEQQNEDLSEDTKCRGQYLTHINERPFKCDQCEYSCTLQSNLSSHKLTDSNERRFRCEQCDYSSKHKDDQDALVKLENEFKQNENLIKHQSYSLLNLPIKKKSFQKNNAGVPDPTGFSTPTSNNSATPDWQISNISAQTSSNNSIFSSNITPVSSDPPSDFTDELKLLGPNWPDTIIEETPENIVISSNENCKSRTISTEDIRPKSEIFFEHHSFKMVDNNKIVIDKIQMNEMDLTYESKNIIHTDTSSMLFEESSIKENSSSFDNACSLDVRTLLIPRSKTNESKKHFCPYCKKMQSKFSRHLQLKHKDEEKVKKFIYLPPNNDKRRKIIAELRNDGDTLHNTKPEFNTGSLILPRRMQARSNYSGEDFGPCKHCGVYLTNTTSRIHVAKCDPSHKKGARDIRSGSRRKAGYIHTCAVSKLRRDIFPILRDDNIVRCIKYDELIIQYGNKLCEKYTLAHQYDTIRAQLRLLGRLKLEIMQIDVNIREFKEIYKPQNFDNVIIGLRRTAHWNENIMWFETPAVAQNLTTLIKKCGYKFRNECIKNQDEESKRSVENFLLLWKEETPTLINKKALEDKINKKRKKKVILPSKEDIKLLYSYLKKESNICLGLLRKGFNRNAWKLLSECTLILLQIFNRRRACEIERLTLIDYQNKESLDEKLSQDIYNKLSESTRNFAKQFVRITLRGKKGRAVFVLLCPFVVEQIDIILKYRKQAGVTCMNEFVFSVPNTNTLSKKYIRACPLLRRFANDCGAVIPSALRNTALRKHIATYTSILNIEESQIDRLANFMGHYTVPVPVAEMTDVSRLLVAAIGDDDSEESDDQNSNSSDDEDDGGNFSLIEHSNTIGPNTSTYNSRGSRRRSGNDSSLRKLKRVKWSDAEKKLIVNHFGDVMQLPKLPSEDACQQLIDKYPSVFKKRAAKHLKSWIDNQRRAEKRKQDVSKLN